MKVIGTEDKRRRRLRRILLGILGLLVLVVLGILVAIPPLVMGDMINLHVQFGTVYKAEDFDLEARELTLRSWRNDCRKPEHSPRPRTQEKPR